ncbi:UDP-4-amino-4,6-dideoxy-N-acetyl-beta-L-altrosamine N-acetyltransferase [Helicobacter sp.]|uniref:UDP-4-amino-4, 6-dideoxy-N-acetyl-beta-L-altrosamine N-acetyltransferase n=1 Tax=Helicobacter sp. TaxID=218 RepID=UPI0019B257DE|nr:UDP-4-amino-4,6-dideoxy-N-acetyl-beta-L-altrosamine N-acetyltransferase [Helicobacter sp.]
MMTLKNFVDLDEIEKILVFGWRNHLKIAPLMKTQTIPLKEHLHFLESLKQDTTKQYFLVLENSEILGVICFVDIRLGISCEFGIYQNPDLQGYGTKLMEAMLKYAFEVLNVATLYACAFNDNTKALALYTKFGFNLTNKDATMSYFTLSAGGGGIK